MRAIVCHILVVALAVLVPVHASGAERLSAMAAQGLENLSQAKQIYLTPTVTAWPTASSVTYGESLASSTLTGGTASVPGTFAFKDPSIVPSQGSYSAQVVFTPTDTATYTTVTGTVSVTVKEIPTVTAWPTASAISYGQTLASSTLSDGTASVEGTFAFDDPTIIPRVETYTAAVTFTPTDTSMYGTVAGTVSVTVTDFPPPGDYTLSDYLGIPLLILLALGIVRLAEMDRVGGPCFIASAAWGTPMAPEVDRLRDFRDNTLLAGALGTAAVDVYYHASPAIADAVAASPALAMLVRMALIPVLMLVSVPAPLLAGVAVLAAVLLLRRIVRRRSAGGGAAE